MQEHRKAEEVPGLLHNFEGLVRLLKEQFTKAPQSGSLKVS